MGSELTADELEEIVLTWMSQQKHDALEEVYGAISLTCSPENKGKRLKLLNGLLAHLVTLNGNESEEAIRKIHGVMQNGGAEIKSALPKLEDTDGDPPQGNVKKENAVPSVKQQAQADASDSVVDLVRFKELKIGGTIFGKGESRISYTSLKHIVENAQKLKYSEPMISAAIIKAISPSHKVKALLETKRGMSVKDIMEMLRNHYKKEDCSSVLTQLRTAVQQPADSALDFVTELMCLKERVIELSREDAYPIDVKMLSKDLFQSMFTGLRNPNIRSELRELCGKQTDVDDQLLTKYVSEAMANEDERQKKLMSAKLATANAVELEPQRHPEPKQHKRDNPFDKIEELRIKQEKDMSILRADFAEVKSALLGKSQAQTQQTQVQQNNNAGSVGLNPVQWQNFSVPSGNFGGAQCGFQEQLNNNNSALQNNGFLAHMQPGAITQSVGMTHQQQNTGQSGGTQQNAGGRSFPQNGGNGFGWQPT